jgi:hypothetical protein
MFADAHQHTVSWALKSNSKVQMSLNPILSNIHFTNNLPSIPRFISLLQYIYKSPYKIADYVRIMFLNCT